MSDDKPYLFPAPAPVLRAGLNAIAESGREFTRDEATCDVMLDLDLVASGRLKKLHAYRYYARRWGWSKTLVAYAFVGRPDRNESPWIEERAASFRSFFGERLRTNGERLRTKTAPEEAENPDLRTSGGHLRTSGGQSRTDSQTTDSQNKEQIPSNDAHHAVSFDAFWEAYPRKVGKKPAKQKWRSAGAAKNPELARRIIGDVERRKREHAPWLKDEGQYIPHPTTYLNQQRWNDEIEANNPRRRAGSSPLPSATKGHDLDNLVEW